jgi:hypothetical protein
MMNRNNQAWCAETTLNGTFINETLLHVGKC